MRISTKVTTFLAGLSTSLILLGSGLSAAAGSASLSLSPAAATEISGTTFTLGVYENGNGSPVNVVTANMNYNSALLQFVGTSCGGAFSNTVTASGGNGGVSLSCYTAPGSAAPTTSAQVGTVSFKALSGSGSAVVAFASSSIVASNGTNVWNGNTAGGTYTLTAPPATTTPVKPAPKPKTPVTSTSSNGSGSTTTTNPGTPKTPAKPAPAPTKKQNNHGNSRDIHGHLVSDKAGLSTGAYWLIGIVAAGVITVMLVFRKKLLDTAKVVATKYSLDRRAQS